jgi:tRNA-modifying protein YgfZ
MSSEILVNGYYRFRPTAWILAEGEEANDFLQSQFSNDFNKMSIGDTSYGLWLDLKGKVHGDSFVYKEDKERFYLMSYETSESLILDKLNSFIVADDVELTGQSSGIGGICFLGDAIGCLEHLGVVPGKSGTFNFEGETVYVILGRRGAQVAIELIGRESCLKALLESLSLISPGPVELDYSLMEFHRIENRCPKIPEDIGPQDLPQEGGLDRDAVSFNKGCYLGQEVMSRLHSMGKVRRSLRLIQCEEFVENGTEIFCDDKKVGILKSSVYFNGTYYSLALLSNVLSKNADLRFSVTDAKVILMPET